MNLFSAKYLSLVSCSQWPVYLASSPEFFALQDFKPTNYIQVSDVGTHRRG